MPDMQDGITGIIVRVISNNEGNQWIELEYLLSSVQLKRAFFWAASATKDRDENPAS